jgi:ribonuclease HI
MINPIMIYGAIGAVIASFFLGFGSGWKLENNRFTTFKQNIAVEAAKKEAENVSLKKQSDLVTKGIQNEYEAKIVALRNFYSTGVQRNSSSSPMPQFSISTIDPNANTTYSILAGQCAETTQQLVSLQDWIKGHLELK